MMEAWYDAKNRRGDIIQKFIEVKDTLEKLQLTTAQQKEQAQQHQTS
jgi:hypothetical protein